MDIPIELFLGFIGVSISLAIFGFLRNPQIPATIVMGGMFILLIAVATDNIIMGFTPLTNSNTIETLVDSNTTAYKYIVSSGSTNSPIGNYSGAAYARGIHISADPSMLMIGEKIQCISYKLQKVGSPPSSRLMTFGIFTLDKSPIQVFGNLNVSSISTSPTNYPICVEEGSERVLQVTDKIGFVWEESATNSTNHIRAFINTGNPFGGTEIRRTAIPFGSSSWISTAGEDYVAELWDYEITFTTTENFNNSIEQSIFTLTELPKTLFALIGVMIMLIGGLMVMRD